MPKRKEVVWTLNADISRMPSRDNVVLTFTRKGIVVNGYYDSFVGIGPPKTIPWADVLRFKAQVEAPDAKA